MSAASPRILFLSRVLYTLEPFCHAGESRTNDDARVICLKINFGLGVLSIPYVLLTLGAVPGVLVILVIALMTTWSSYVMGTTKLRHPELGSIADVGLFLSGPILRDFLLGGYVICASSLPYSFPPLGRFVLMILRIQS